MTVQYTYAGSISAAGCTYDRLQYEYRGSAPVQIDVLPELAGQVTVIRSVSSVRNLQTNKETNKQKKKQAHTRKQANKL